MTTQELNLSRRSINFFDDTKELDIGIVKKVINEAVYAPSSMNLQPWRLIVVKTKENKEKLYNLAFKQQKVLDAPVTLIIISDFAAYEASNPAWEDRIKSKGLESVQETIDKLRTKFQEDTVAKHRFGYLNTGLFAMNLMTLFKAYGVDTHPIGGMKYDEVHKEFELGEHEQVSMLLSVGYHDDSKEIIKRKKRKNYKQIANEK